MLGYIVLFVVFSLNLLLGIVVFKSNPRSNSNKLFFLLTIITSLWVITNVLMGLFNSVTFLKINLSIASFLPTTALWWSYYFIKNGNSRKNALIFFTSLSSIFAITPYIGQLIISSVNSVTIGTLNGQYGVLFPYYSFYLIFATSYLFIIFYRYRLKSKGIVRGQIGYIIFGLFGFALVPIVLSLILPNLHINTFAGLDSFGSLILIGSISYAIVRHRLFDIKVFIVRSLLYGILLSLVALSFVFITFISAQYFEQIPAAKYAGSFLVATLIVFGLDPLKRILSRTTDKIFFQAKIDYTKLLQKLSSIISLELDLQKLIDDLEKGLIQGLKVKSSLILLRDQDKGKTRMFRATAENGATDRDVVIDNDSQLIKFVREHQHLSLLEALERKIEDTPEGPARDKEEASRAEFERLGVALVAPIFSENHLVAVLTLGPKLSGDSFSNEDTQLIDVLAPQIGSAIQKANLYEEVREFSAGLKVKVQEATKELQTRNVSLQTLQTITKDITRTLDFNKVVQNIANAVSTELGFLGAILVFLDDDGKTLRARAVTETSLTQKALKLLPVKFTDYTTDSTNPKTANLGTRVIQTGEIQYSENMVDVLSPPIPKPIVIMMQKVMGIKTMILVPIIAEDKVIGVIEVGAKRSREHINQSEIETLQSMADELGVVARNISLFDRVRKTNDQLETANAHLKQLDQAKSEFVSIASHQLRTPMTGIMGYLSMMTQGDFGKVKPEHQKILVDLLAESQRMIRLINQFLNVSKIEAGKFTYTWKPTQMEELVTHVVKEVEKPASDKGLKLTVKMPKSKLPIIQADADKIEDVVLNLIDNAIKYTAKGTIVVTLALEGVVVHFRVKDSGIGIKPQDATELFNKFVRGSGIAQIHPDGSGLGLFIAKSIIDAHGGKIWAESDGEAKGSTFQFTLPLKPPADVVAMSAAAVVTKKV